MTMPVPLPMAPSITDYENFLPEVMPWARACSELVALQAIRNSAIEFCDRSGWWKFEPDPFPLIEGQSDYVVEVLPMTDMVTLLNAYYDERRLEIRTPDQLGRRMSMDYRQLKANQPTAITQMNSSTVRVSPIPTDIDPADLGIALVISLKPTRDSTGVLKEIADLWTETIAQGALARLYSQMETPYSSPQAMQMARAMFNSGVDDARAQVNLDYGRTGITVAIPRFI